MSRKSLLYFSTSFKLKTSRYSNQVDVEFLKYFDAIDALTDYQSMQYFLQNIRISFEIKDEISLK